MSQGQSCHDLRGQLRLFDERSLADESVDRQPGSFSPTMTLSELYREWIRPVWFVEQQTDRKTIAEYDRSLDLWASLTGDPALEQIDQQHDAAEAFFEQIAAALMAGLWKLPGKRGQAISAYTVLRRVANVQSCLRLAGWPEGKRKGKKLIRIVPYLALPPVEDQDPEGPQVWELTRIFAAADQMKVPRLAGVTPGVFWRSIGRLAYNTAERRGALLQLRFADIREIRETAPLPGVELDASPVSYEVHIPAAIRKGKRKKHFVPLNAPALEAIESMRTDVPRELIYPWPHTLEYFSENWMKLVRLAGFPAEPRFHFHRIRSTATSEAELIKQGSGTLLAGHSDSRVTHRFYTQRRVLRATLSQLPQP